MYRSELYKRLCVRFILVYYIDGLQNITFKLNKSKEDVLFTENRAYNDKVSVNPKKIQDISKVKQYIPQEYQGFYDEILDLPTSNDANRDNDNSTN